MAKADPYDVQTWQDLGSAAMTAHRYQEAVEAFRKVTALQPDNADAWNLLGYSSAFAGDADGASRAIAQYGKVAPGAPNPLDSLGDVQLMNGHLPEAEKTYLENARKYPQFYAGLDLLKAAMARLMTGDVAGADGLAQQYFTARMAAKDAAVDYRRAQWAWISGRRKAACAQMEQVAGAAAASNGGRNLASHAYMELAMWSLMLGNREPAAAMAQKAAALATPVSAMQATLARFLTQAPASADEWKARAALLVRQRPDAPIGKTALADALLFAKEFAAAQPILQSMYDSGNNTADEGLPVLLAWADVETGRIDQAAALVDVLPALADSGLSWSTALYFPRVFYLRGAIAEKQGKADEARENFRIFHQLSGPDPLLWGEEQEGR